MTADSPDTRFAELERSAHAIATYREDVGRCPSDGCSVEFPGYHVYRHAPTCDECACAIVERHGGHYVGFFTEDNPNRIAERCEGHAFAIVDERYLVDPWAKDVMGQRAVYDLTSSVERTRVRELYGDPRTWHMGDDTERPASEISEAVRRLILTAPPPP